MSTTFSPFAKPLYVMAKPVGATCNLACDYCYYLEKSKFYSSSFKTEMSETLLEKFIAQYLEAQTMPQVQFTWHGGEPLLRPLSFYKKVVALQQKYARGKQIENCIQTNGTLLTAEWCEFFREERWLVGISIDGAAKYHDAYRKNKCGKPSFQAVMNGINLLQRHRVEWNAMAVVNALNAEDPVGFYRFFKELGCQYLQFTPVVERKIQTQDGEDLLASIATKDKSLLTPFSVSPAQWGNFLCTIFDEWIKTDVGHIFVQIFDATLSNWLGLAPGLCTIAKHCGHAGVMEYNGDVYACDHFVFPEYKLGNIHEKTLVEMMYSPTQQRFGTDKFDRLTAQCRSCEFVFACNGECPRNRFAYSQSGEAGHNYLCEGYYNFFTHVAPYMDYMKQELLQDRPPANIMQAIAKGEFPTL